MQNGGPQLYIMEITRSRPGNVEPRGTAPCSGFELAPLPGRLFCIFNPPTGGNTRMNEYPAESAGWTEHKEVSVDAEWKRPDGTPHRRGTPWSRELTAEETPPSWDGPEPPTVRAVVVGRGTVADPYGVEVTWGCPGFPPLELVVEAADVLTVKGVVFSLAFVAGFPWPAQYVRLQQVGAADGSPAGLRAQLSGGGAVQGAPRG